VIPALREALAGHPERKLLFYDTGRTVPLAAISVGDPDTADNIAVFVGGVGMSVETLADVGVREATQLVRRAEDLCPGQTTAVISWLGYEPPTGVFDRSAVTNRRAKAAAVALNSFLADLPRAHLTVLGHSYGSAVVGYAAESWTGVDDMVVFASPGAGEKRPKVAPGHAFALLARGDWIVWPARLFAPYLGINPMKNPYYLKLSTEPTDSTTLSDKHGRYLWDGSEGQHNIAAVVAGAYDQLRFR
jgi:pimeloyl-ACP methyl ester carboxylesterase